MGLIVGCGGWLLVEAPAAEISVVADAGDAAVVICTAGRQACGARLAVFALSSGGDARKILAPFAR